MKTTDFSEYKKLAKKISMVTCYDFTSAQIVAQSDVDCVLVGDSAGMTMAGFETTLNTDMETMVLLTSWVARGLKNSSKFIVGDMPFLSFRIGIIDGTLNAKKLIQAGAHAVKLEGAKGNLDLIRHLVDSGIPVMGHLGLTPQSVHALGGFKVQGRLPAQAQILLEEALQLQQAGCFALVLECVPRNLAKKISQKLKIATIGIGAGSDCDGQVLVWQDLLGLQKNFTPKFVRSFAHLFEESQKALNDFNKAVKGKKFPSSQESYE